MNIALTVLIVLFAVLALPLGLTRYGAWQIERDNPPVGTFASIGGTRIHYVHVPASAPDLPPVVVIHGATANLKDQMVPLRPILEGRAELLFFDRPGMGWSERGTGNDTIDGQVATLARLMDHVGMRDAVIVGHSFGAAVAAAFALSNPERTRGLVLLSGATHPWPGGETSWYYDVSASPLLGPLFVNTLAYPAGMLRMAEATRCVFAPNPVPPGYGTSASIPLILRPSTFRANAIDVAALYAHVERTAPRYATIAKPTVVISGDSDTVVYEEIHSLGLARDIPGAELVWVHNLGHKPDWVAADLVLAAVETVTGRRNDIQQIARRVEARIAADAEGAADCVDEKPADAQPAVP